MSGDNRMINSHDYPTRSDEAIATVRVEHAATSTVEQKKDLWAVRTRRRRERPQKLRTDCTEAKDERPNLYQPDIESFVSGCIPGVSIATCSSQRRTRLFRQRPLPLLSYLASTQLAVAEKKRKKEEAESRNAIAEEEAKKAMLLNPIVPNGEGVTLGRNTDSVLVSIPRSNAGGPCDKSLLLAPRETIKAEELSNILMPPLLKSFLSQLE